MAWRITALLALLLCATGCSEACAGEQAEAARVLAAFQDALFRGDRGELRRLCTEESRAVVGDLPLDAVAGRQPLKILGVRGERGEFLVDVEDPNEGNRRSCFVVVKEWGQLRVDLVATTRFNHVEHVVGDGAPVLEPRSLDPGEIERIRAEHPELFR